MSLHDLRLKHAMWRWSRQPLHQSDEQMLRRLRPAWDTITRKDKRVVIKALRQDGDINENIQRALSEIDKRTP